LKTNFIVSLIQSTKETTLSYLENNFTCQKKKNLVLTDSSKIQCWLLFCWIWRNVAGRLNKSQ